MSILSLELQEKIEKWTKKYPPEQRQSAIIPALLLAQDENNGSLSNEFIEAIADYLNMPAIAAYEVAAFYSMYELKPVGKHKICVCTNISCMLAGSEELVAHLEKKLGIKMGETTVDGKFTLKEVECLAACKDAPMFQIGKTYYEKLSPEKVDQILDSLE
ncbi:MAG: NADH-quinone oxidoreductase chain 2 [Legionellaceae bacterium]